MGRRAGDLVEGVQRGWYNARGGTSARVHFLMFVLGVYVLFSGSMLLVAWYTLVVLLFVSIVPVCVFYGHVCVVAVALDSPLLAL